MGLDIRTLTSLWNRKQLDDTNHNFKQLKENIGTVDENAVGSEQLKEDSVGTAELKKEAVTKEKLAKNSVDESILKDSTINRKKMNTTVESELNIYAENNLSKTFDLINKDYISPGASIEWYNRNFGSIKEIMLIGFDSSKEHRLRLFARNHSSFKYRFIICSRANKNESWKDVFDTKSDFVVTENKNGITEISNSIGNKTVNIKIDYSNINDGDSINDGSLGVFEGRYKIKDNCFYENTILSTKKDILNIKKEVSMLKKSKLLACVDGRSIKIKYRKHEGLNEIVEFNELGINKIIHPKKFYEEKATYLTSDFSNMKLNYTLENDWISPYQNVKALNNGINSFSGTVGGNHGTEGAGGFPTAKNSSVDVYVDGNQINDSLVISGDIVTIVVKNIVSAPNKINLVTGEKAESLLETVIYKVTENNIEVFVNIKALEEIEVGGYVGLQMTTDIIKNGQVYFLDGPTKYSVDSILHPSAPLPFKNDRMIFENESDVVVIQTKRDYGVGDLKFKGTAPIHFMSEFNKLYSHLLNETVALKKGQSIDYSGSYTFMNKMKCDGAEAAYFFVENEEIIYCVDFFGAVEETFLEVSLSFVGKKITIVDSKNVEIQDVVSFEGLKLKSTGLGFVKFKVNN